MDTVKNWSELTPQERREERFKQWLPGSYYYIGPEHVQVSGLPESCR